MLLHKSSGPWYFPSVQLVISLCVSFVIALICLWGRSAWLFLGNHWFTVAFWLFIYDVSASLWTSSYPQGSSRVLEVIRCPLLAWQMMLCNVTLRRTFSHKIYLAYRLNILLTNLKTLQGILVASISNWVQGKQHQERGWGDTCTRRVQWNWFIREEKRNILLIYFQYIMSYRLTILAINLEKFSSDMAFNLSWRRADMLGILKT